MEVTIPNYNLTAFNNIIYKDLHKLPDTTYRVESNVDYLTNIREHRIFCEVIMTKCINYSIRIPNSDVDKDKMDSYINFLINKLNEKITGIPIDESYIEINGVKYYPEKREVI